MKLLIVTDAWRPQINGVVRTFEGLVRDMQSLGHNVKVISPQDFGWNAPCPSYPEIRLAFPKSPLFEMTRMIDAFRPDALHIATEGPLGQCARNICVLNGYGYTSSPCTSFDQYIEMRVPGPLRPLAARFSHAVLASIHNHAERVLIATETVGQDLRRWGVHRETAVVSRGVDTGLFTPGPARLYAGGPGPVSLYVGRVALEKNLEAFLDMDIPGSKIVVGDGPDLAALKEKYAPDSRIVFEGPKAYGNLPVFFQSADIFVFPSRTDTFGRVMIEALACGTPVVALPVNGGPVVVTGQLQGELDEDLAAAWRRLHDRTVSSNETAKQGRHDDVALRFGNMKFARTFAEQTVPFRKPPGPFLYRPRVPAI